jgi:hypothetical protein
VNDYAAVLRCLRAALAQAPCSVAVVPQSARDRAYREGVEGVLACALGYRSPRVTEQAVSTAAYTLELRRLELAFTRANVSVLVLKGGSLVHSVYAGRPAWRTLEDLDLLPRPGHHGRAAEALAATGYREVPGAWVRDGHALDLHADLLGAWRVPGRARAYRFDSDLLWAAAVPLWTGSRSLYKLEDSVQFAHLAVHAMKHGYEKLKWLVDLALLAPELNGEQLRSTVQRTGTARPVSLALHLQQRLLAVPLQESLRTLCLQPTAGEQAFLYLADRGRHPRILGDLLTAWEQPGLAGKLAYLRDMMWPVGEEVPLTRRLGDVAQVLRRELDRLLRA